LQQAVAEAAKEASRPAKMARAGAGKKRLLRMGVGILILVGVLGGSFFAYRKLTAEPPPPPRKPKPVVKPAPQPEQPPPSTAETAATSAETTTGSATPKPAENPVEKPVETTAAIEPAKPAAPPPPPPPSMAFRAWAENLRISGMRGGSNPRIFIGGTAYQKGDLVNPQMGIVFDDYIDATRTIVFKDKSGAKVERRN
jgi:outer membrane biosynthesis protein TonB